MPDLSSERGQTLAGLRCRGDPTSRQRRQTLAGLRWRGPAPTVNYRYVLSSERMLQNNKPQLSTRQSQGEIKIGRGSQMGA
jgi:hypothetical protein